jgi:branched-chain amino acid transport system ATP-binding protein
MMADVVPLLRTQNLTMRFGGVTAVRDVNLTLGEVELRCLIGPNGAGKSTFFKMLTGQLKPTSGTIEFRGERISGALSHEIARLGIGIKTQVPNVFNGLPVRENVWLAARRGRTTKQARAVVDEILQKIRLTERANDLVGQLSHGQRQWVEIGTVLAGDPVLILLDEPAAGMTDDETVRTAEIIREINKTHGLIVVEHDMQFIKMIAKTVTVFHQGAILMEDTIDAVMRDQRVRDVYLGKKVAA